MPDVQKPVTQIEYAGPGIDMRPRVRWLGPALLTVALLVVGVLFILSTLPEYGQSPRVRCANNLRQIGLACLMYANDHANQYPDNLSVVLRDEDITPEVFVCPSSNDTPARGPTKQALAANLTAGGHLSYIYVGKGLTSAAPADAVLAYEPLANHRGEGMEVLYADGHVEFQSSLTARNIIAELQSGHNPPRPEKLK